MRLSIQLRALLLLACISHQLPATAGDAERKLAAIRAADRHGYPTADIDLMLGEIERGYGET
ncbi:MAG: hypothetical protein KAJ97_02445 [Acidobacteria bacterium]|nr:hypothetical protein [Acidobacteriota bacterium]